MWVFFLAKKKVRVCLVYKCTCCRYIVFIVFLILTNLEFLFLVLTLALTAAQ